MVLDADSCPLATYGVIHISCGHIPAQVRILRISCHLYITMITISFNLTLWVACMPLESYSAYNMYLFNLQMANHNKDNMLQSLAY